MVLRDDRQGLDFVARVPRGIPTHEWALGLGDALHNLRSSLDAAAWGMAHFGGATPTRPKRVSFPVCSDPKEWAAAVKDWVGELPPDLRNRLQVLQPYTYGLGQPSVLTILHELDIQDKHRDMLTVSCDLGAINIDGSFRYEDETTDAVPRLEMLEGRRFADGVILGTLHAGATVATIGQTILRPAVRVQLVYQSQTFDVPAMVQQFVDETRRYLDILMAGLEPVGPEEQWSPLEVNYKQD